MRAAREPAARLIPLAPTWSLLNAGTHRPLILGGFAGTRVEIGRSDGVSCDAVLFVTPSGYQFGPEFPSTRPIVNQFTLLNVGGSVLVVGTTDFPGSTEFEERAGAPRDREAHVDHQVQLHDILNSIVIRPR